MVKKIATVTGMAVLLGTAGVAGNMLSRPIKDIQTYEQAKFADCDAKLIQYENSDGYYCATGTEYAKDKADLKTRLIQNKTNGKDDIGLGKMIVQNDKTARAEIAKIFIDKYDTKTKQFDGMKFDKDIIDQAFIAVEIANLKCGGGCVLSGDTMTEKVYNLLNK